MASIQKRENSKGVTSYRVEVRLKGCPPQRATFARLTDAKKWAASTESAIRENRYFKTAEARRHTFDDLVKRYISEVLSKKPEKARKLQTTQMNWWHSQLGHHTLADVSPALITECREKLSSEKISKGKHRSPATINRYLAALSHAFTVATNEWGWVDDSPMKKVKKLKEPSGRTRFLSQDETINGNQIQGELTRFLNACKHSQNQYLYIIVVLALSTGMRRGEIMSLKWSDVDLNRNRLTLYKTKNEEIRAIPLTGLARELIAEHSKVRAIDTDLLFPSETKRIKPQNIDKVWISALHKAGIDNFKFHDLRHSAASYLAMNGASLAEIAEILGHKTLQMVKRYAHLSESHTANVIAKMNENIFG